jgi:ATP adenylyltransferase
VTERLWAPWRAAYIVRSAGKRATRGGGRKAPEECIFCDLPALRRDRANLILRRGERIFVMLNKYPYNNGHLLVAPYAHVPELTSLPGATLHELVEEVRDAVERLRKVLKPDGFNVGLNLGEVAGAGYAGHVHFHVVPRWNGDTSFMPVASGTRVISQSLEAARKALEPVFRGAPPR